MSLLAVQLNHPGVQKKYPSKGYIHLGNKIIRIWNNDPSHYRKFIHNEGEYLKTLKSSPIKDQLLFWGEWEGNSFFNPLPQINHHNPNGIHEPFHSIQIRGSQNTDPYIYGDYFYYATCKQRGKMCNLNPGSVILFGSVAKNVGFLLDTVYVIGPTFETAINVATNKAKNYSRVYREETLEQLGNEYLGHIPDPNKRIFYSQTWYDNKNFFSFVPCKISNEKNKKGFDRVLIPFNGLIAGINFTSNAQAIKHLHDDPEVIQDIWEEVVKLTLSMGYYLGIRFTEPCIVTNIKNDNYGLER